MTANRHEQPQPMQHNPRTTRQCTAANRNKQVRGQGNHVHSMTKHRDAHRQNNHKNTTRTPPPPPPPPPHLFFFFPFSSLLLLTYITTRPNGHECNKTEVSKGDMSDDTHEQARTGAGL